MRSVRIALPRGQHVFLFTSASLVLHLLGDHGRRASFIFNSLCQISICMCRRPGQMAVSLLPACNLSPLAADSVMQITQQPTRRRSNTNSRPRYVVNCQNNYITFCALAPTGSCTCVRLCGKVAQKATGGWKKERAAAKNSCADHFPVSRRIRLAGATGAKCDFHRIDKRRLQLSRFGEQDE